MKAVTFTEFKRRLTEWLDRSHQEPINIHRGGTLVAVLMSPEEYEHLQAIDDAFWVARAKTVEAAGDWVDHDGALQFKTAHFHKSANGASSHHALPSK